MEIEENSIKKEEKEEEEEEEEEIDTGPPRYEQIKILFDPISIAKRKTNCALLSLEDLCPSEDIHK